ncbi:hypothetical protein ACLM5H_18660 [Fredinandcohnia humi]
MSWDWAHIVDTVITPAKDERRCLLLEFSIVLKIFLLSFHTSTKNGLP